MARLFILCLLALYGWGTSNAYAARGDDMFSTTGFESYDRPAVPSDSLFQSDMFPTRQPYMRETKDMFDHTRPMGDFGGEDMFPYWRHQAPDQPLFNWPRGSSYP